jgi:hypothetical protein
MAAGNIFHRWRFSEPKLWTIEPSNSPHPAADPSSAKAAVHILDKIVQHIKEGVPYRSTSITVPLTTQRQANRRLEDIQSHDEICVHCISAQDGGRLPLASVVKPRPDVSSELRTPGLSIALFEIAAGI